MYGPLLPVLSERWGMSDGRAGMLFTAVFCCAVFGATSVTLLLRWFSGWRLMVVGFLMTGLGSLGLSSGFWELGFVGSCLLGFGLGLVNPTANLAAAAMWPGRTASALTLLNFFFSVGAVAAPPVIGFCIERGWSIWFPAVFAVVTLVGAGFAARLKVADYLHSDSQNAEGGGREAALGVAATVGKPELRGFALACMLLLFLYVGVEVSLGGWCTTYLLRSTDASQMLAASAPSAFWAAILLSRVVTVLILPRVGILAVLVGGGVLSLVGSAAMLGSSEPAFVLMAIAVAGVGLGPVFPSAVGYFLQFGGPNASRIAGLLFAAGSVGGAVLPMLVGQVSERSQDLHTALWLVPAAAVLLLGAVGVAAWRRPGRTALAEQRDNVRRGS